MERSYLWVAGTPFFGGTNMSVFTQLVKAERIRQLLEQIQRETDPRALVQLKKQLAGIRYNPPGEARGHMVW
ncbi:MAG: hypothetical protein HOE53_01455 [Candidatus Magasanikbacteria bacterium]|jgi:hypothetical protein|nr:hypothetical protein [Candidatus Magasanikbacteria bacterium]